MSKVGPILLIEDDHDDKDIFKRVLREIEITNELVWFDNCNRGLEYLLTTSESVFLIFCDINLPGKNGIEFKRSIDEDPKLRKKCIPFVFYSTTATQKDVNTAYLEMTTQGFFKKGTDFQEMKQQIKTIFDYWIASKHPNTQ